MSAKVNNKKKDNRSKKKRRLGYLVSKRKNKLIKDAQTLSGQIRLGILRCLATKIDDGMSTSELEAAVPCHRDTVYDVCEELKYKGMVTKKGNKFGNYHITSKAVGSPEIKGFLFGSKAMEQFYLFEHPGPESTLKQSISVNNKFCNNNYCKSVVLRQPHDGIIPDKELKDELSLFEFAIRIGSIITYEMIQALKYGSSPILENQVNKDIMAWKWVDNVIKPDLTLNAFAKLDPVGNILKRNKNVDQPRGPLYEVDEKGDLKQLERSFENVFPDVYDRLENIIESIPGEVDLIRNHAIEHTSSRKLSS
jgi:hypothetical protein